MTAQTIDCRTLPEPLPLHIGRATETDAPDNGPDSDYIDPADYPDTTAYLNALPGVAERILSYNNIPEDEWEDVPEECFHV